MKTHALLRGLAGSVPIALLAVVALMAQNSPESTDPPPEASWQKVNEARDKGLPQTAIKHLEPIIAQTMAAGRHALVQYDVLNDEIILNAEGRCIEVQPGEPGLLLGHINEEAVFEGYTNPEATEKKIVRNAFEDGDAWFNSGDLMKQVEAGFTLGYPHYQFVDRVGDTFRWKGENVSTNEVGEIINGFPQVRISNVYGVTVPGADGRAGMAALALEPDVEQLDLEGFSDHVVSRLPSYARPVFLRIESEIDVTGTFKMVKGALREQGYDPDKVSDPLYVMKPGSSVYEPLDREYAALIARGEAGF